MLPCVAGGISRTQEDCMRYDGAVCRGVEAQL